MNQPGVYGPQGSPAPGNVPGARIPAAGWADRSGNFWVFGGAGFNYTTAGGSGVLNDLWKFDGHEWTWEAGSFIYDQGSIFGTQGVPAPGNTPSARQESASWTDSSGNLWLFGGNEAGFLNDLWEYTGGQWAWMSGSQVSNPPGVYGTQGVPSAGLVPGGRFNPSSHWIDLSGNLWLLGGWGSMGTAQGDLSDLWRYTPNWP